MDRYREREELAFLRTGIVASTIANCSPSDRREPFTPQDFMPPTMVHKIDHEPTREEVLASMRELNSLFGGEDLTNGR